MSTDYPDIMDLHFLDTPEKVQELALGGPTLQELEEASYNAALEAGDAEVIMWQALADIRDTGLWQGSGQDTFKDYLSSWTLEVYQRAKSSGRNSPISLRQVQKMLGLHRRLVSGLGMEAEEVFTANADVMDTFTRAMGDWDTKTGAVKYVPPLVQEALDKKFPDLERTAQIKAAAEEIAAIPRHGEAIATIKATYGPPNEATHVHEWIMEVSEHGEICTLKCKESEVDVASGEIKTENWHWFTLVHDAPLSRRVLEAMARRLGTAVFWNEE
jgi:hypothetical protein